MSCISGVILNGLEDSCTTKYSIFETTYTTRFLILKTSSTML